MKKKSIITILLALVAVAGQGEVKSGFDLCLRDEATGEWLIGLFDDYAIYDCEYWNYAEVGKDRVVLTKDGLRKEIRLKKNAVTIDGVKHKTSLLTTKFLPDYPSKDETAWASGIHVEEDSLTLRVCVRTKKGAADFGTFINRLIDGKQIRGYGKTDSQGRFELRMPVNGPSVMVIRNESAHPLEHSFWQKLAVENGDTLLLYIDDVNDRIYVMGGKYARFNNELLGSDFHPRFVVTDEMTIDSTINEQRQYMAECQTRMDSLNAARPNLSRRFRTYYKDDLLVQFAYPMLLKCCWPSGGESRSELVSKTEAELNPLQWTRSEVPLMCRRYFTVANIFYYITAQTEIKSPRPKDPSDFILQLYQEGKVQLTDEELQKVKSFQDLRANYSGDVDLNDAFQSDIIPILGKPLITQYWDWDQSERSIPIEVNVINSLDMDDASREILKAQTFMKTIDGKSHVASPRVMELAHQEIHHPQLIQAIDDAKQRIADFLAEQQRQQTAVPEAGTPASRRVSEEELKDITDGRNLFERIIAPFRGHVVYVDVWGTWCGPCRAEMENVPDLKKRLESKPVVYLYFCNNSSEDAWRTFVSQKHLDTDNAVHYNLPRAQESAIEQYLEVSGFPTYRLVDTAGRLMPGEAPRPSNLSGTVSAIEQLLNP